MVLFWGGIMMFGNLFPPLFYLLPVLWFFSFFHTHNLNNMADEEFYALEDGYLFDMSPGQLLRAADRHRKPLALILGGETVVRLTGRGKGGRNQELALAAAPVLAGTEGTALFSVGSDGTDGPTDAAGGYVDGGTRDRLRALGMEVPAVLAENDSYHALKKIGGLIVTGPTGTNVNDVSVGLYRPSAMP